MSTLIPRYPAFLPPHNGHSASTSQLHSQFQTTDAIVVFLNRVVTDLQHWLNSRWTAGFVPFHRGLTPELELVCTSGDGPGAQCPELVCPIQGKIYRGLSAVVAIGPKCDGTHYSASDRELAESLCDHVGRLLAHERAARNVLDEFAEEERVKHETEVARDIYDRLDHLGLPRIPGLEFSGQCHRGGALGGDFFELLPHGDRELFFAIGNVAGNGSPGSLMLGSTTASIRALAGHGAGLGDITVEINHLLWELSPENAYSSSFCAGIDSARGRLRYVNAGHEPALVFRRQSGRVERLESTGAVLGLTRRSAYRERIVCFEPGDVLLAYSSGVSETIAPDQMMRLLRESGESSIQDFAARFLPAQGPQDCTVIAVRSTDSYGDHAIVQTGSRPASHGYASVAA